MKDEPSFFLHKFWLRWHSLMLPKNKLSISLSRQIFGIENWCLIHRRFIQLSKQNDFLQRQPDLRRSHIPYLRRNNQFWHLNSALKGDACRLQISLADTGDGVRLLFSFLCWCVSVSTAQRTKNKNSNRIFNADGIISVSCAHTQTFATCTFGERNVLGGVETSSYIIINAGVDMAQQHQITNAQRAWMAGEGDQMA